MAADLGRRMLPAFETATGVSTDLSAYQALLPVIAAVGTRV